MAFVRYSLKVLLTYLLIILVYLLTLLCGRDAPVVTCFSSSAFVGDRNAFLRCNIKARPWVTALYWILDLNGTTIGKADSVSDYWTKVMVLMVVSVFCCVCHVTNYTTSRPLFVYSLRRNSK